MRVPTNFRVLVDRVCRHTPLGRAGTWLYWRAAEAAAAKLSALPGVVSVRLRGGMLRGCRPGISDLDFTVLLNDGDEAGETRDCRRVLGAFRNLKRALPMLGELTLTTVSRWALFETIAPGPLHWYRRQLEYRRGQWAAVDSAGSPHCASLFSLALDHFSLAQKALSLGNAYGRIVFEKELAKSASLAGTEPGTGSLVDKTARVLEALDDLALRALDWKAPRPPQTLPIRPRGEDQDAKRILSDWAVREVTRASPLLEAGEAPFTVVGARDSARAWLPFVVGRKPYPIGALTPAMEACQKNGWGGWWTAEPLAWFSPAPKTEAAGQLFASLVERLCHDAVTVFPARALLACDADRELWLMRAPVEIAALGNCVGSVPLPAPRAADDLTRAVRASREAAFVAGAAWRQRAAPDRSTGI